MSSERDAVTEACDVLAEYFGRLEYLAAEPPPPDGGPAGLHSRPALIPEPYGDAGRALMTALEGVRRLEASLRLAILGHPGARRPLSDRHTAASLAMVTRLASQLDDERFSRACRFLDAWISDARAVHGIDENRRWRHLPRQGDPDDPAALPPQCPYCKTFYLVYDPEAGIVACSLYGCADRNGQPPQAEVGTDEHGRPELHWRDGRKQLAPDLGAAACDSR